MSDEFQFTIPVVRGEGVGVPIGEIQRAINSICQQSSIFLNEITSGGFPQTNVNITGGTITGVTGATQPTTDNSTLLATDQFVNQQIIRSTATVPLTLTGGVYNQATLGTGFSPVIFASGGVVTGILTIVNPGNGYAVGDLLTPAGGNNDAALRVATLSGSGVASVSILYGGTGYTTGIQVTGTPIPPGDRNVELTGVLTSNVTFIIAAGTYNTALRRPSFANNTTGAFTVTVFLSNGAGGTTGSGYVLPQGTANSTSVLLQTDGQSNVWPVDTPQGIGALPSTNPTITGGTINNTPIGATTPSTGSFTTLAASSTVSGAGFTARFASPGPIGSTAASTGAFTTVSATGTITPSSTNGIVGTATNDNANAGSVGELLTNATTGTALTTATPANATSVSLTAGDWDVYGVATYVPAGTTTVTSMQTGISTNSGAFGAANTGSYTLLQVNAAGVLATGGLQAQPSGTVRVSLSGTTTVYLVALSNFAVSTMTCNGFIRARRVR